MRRSRVPVSSRAAREPCRDVAPFPPGSHGLPPVKRSGLLPVTPAPAPYRPPFGGGSGRNGMTGPPVGLPLCRPTVLPLRRGTAAGPPSGAPGATGRTGWPNWQGRCDLRDHKMPGRADCVTMRLPAGGIWTRPDTRPPLYRRNASCACRTYGRRICGSGRGRRRGGNPGTAFRGRCGADGDAPDH